MQSRSSQKTLLVAEDEPVIAELIQTILERAGYRVIVARNGQSALELIRRDQPAAAIVDVNMPLMDGFEVLSSLAANPPTSMPRTLVLTARMALGDVEKAIALGASDYLAKPFTDMTLLRRVGRLLGEGVRLN
jgi:CheY-like chemotaxis protein